MTGLLVCTTIGWWHSAVLHSGTTGHLAPVIFVDSNDYLAIYGDKEGGTWQYDTVDNLYDIGGFSTSLPYIYVDRWNHPYVVYYPWYSGYGYRCRYGFRDNSGWHTEFPNMDIPRSIVVDSLDIVHTVMHDSSGVYHIVRYPNVRAWRQLERIDTFSDAQKCKIAIDSQGYLHVAFTNSDRTKLIYTTNNPEVGVWEASPPEFRQTLILSMAPSGFLISGYSGPIQVYDSGGRLLMSREIKGKTLVSPLSPGVYFVMAGKQRGKVAVR